MKKIVLFAFFALCATLAIAKDVTIVATGTAMTKEYALNKALCNAFEQQFGKQVESNSNSEAIVVLSILWGNIEKVKSYKIISIKETKDKYGAPQMTAKIEVTFDMDKIEEHNKKQ